MNIQLIENRHTLSLEAQKLHVYRGWNEYVARRLAGYTRRPGTPLTQDIERWDDWYAQADRTVYALGKRASLLSMASFSHRPLGDAEFEFQINDYTGEDDPDTMLAFAAAAHSDFDNHSRYEGNIWTKLPEGDQSKYRLYDRLGYDIHNDISAMIKLGSLSFMKAKLDQKGGV